MKLVNSKKVPVVCLVKKLSFDPKGYELIIESPCLKCNKMFYVYGKPNIKNASGKCPHCDEKFQIFIF